VQNFADFFVGKPHVGHETPSDFASEMLIIVGFFDTKNEESEGDRWDEVSVTEDTPVTLDWPFLSMVFFISNMDFIARNSNAEYFSTESINAAKYS